MGVPKLRQDQSARRGSVKRTMSPELLMILTHRHVFFTEVDVNRFLDVCACSTTIGMLKINSLGVNRGALPRCKLHLRSATYV
jgi:hypothetical protein